MKRGVRSPLVALVPAGAVTVALLAACGNDEASTITFTRYDGAKGNVYAMS